jgi:glutathione S-transferase
VITLHHCLSARSFRPLWALEELELRYELKLLPFPPRAAQRSFLELNPLGTVPLLVDGHGDEAVRMSESAAICQYLAARHDPGGLDVAAGEPDFGAYLNFLHFGEATLTFPQTLVLRYRHFEPAERRQPQVADDYAKWFLARLRTLDARLAERQFLCAGRFSAADISVGYALLLAQHLDLATQFTPAVAAYWQRLQQRPAYRRAQDRQWAAAREQGVPLIAAPDLRP